MVGLVLKKVVSDGGSESVSSLVVATVLPMRLLGRATVVPLSGALLRRVHGSSVAPLSMVLFKIDEFRAFSMVDVGLWSLTSF